MESGVQEIDPLFKKLCIYNIKHPIKLGIDYFREYFVSKAFCQSF